MRKRKYLGPVIGAVLALAFATAAFANSSQGTVVNGLPGWNTPTFLGVSSTQFQIWSCTNHNSDLNAYYDWMHHWPIFPSTGTLLVRYPCRNNTTHWSYTWSESGTADRSVEYTHYNSGYFSDSWWAGY